MFRNLKAKIQERKLDFNYTDILHNVLQSIFVYDDRIFRPDMLDYILHEDGKCALIKTSVSDYTPVYVEFAGGERYPDGTSKTAICFDEIGNRYEFANWMRNDDIIVLFNTPSRTPSGFIDLFAYQLTETNKSENCNVIFSRLRPFLTAHDEKTKNRIETALKSILSGDLSAIFVDTDITTLLNGSENSSGIDVLNITNVKDAQEIQYLSHFYDTIISRFYFLCGVGMADNGKQAQITVDELNRNADASFILPLAWYNGRKILKDKGLYFDFAPLWKAKYNAILNHNENDSADQSEEPEEPEKEVEENESD